MVTQTEELPLSDRRRAGLAMRQPARTAPVHVLFVIDQLCEAGGAERILLDTIRLLPRSRFRCSLATFKLDATLPLFQSLPCPYVVLPLRKTYDLQAFRVGGELREFIRKADVRIVHTFHETSDLWAGFVSKLGGGPLLVSSRRDMGILRSLKHNIGYRLMNSKFDLVTTVSEQVRKFCIEKDQTDSARVVTIYNGVELDKISACSRLGPLRAKIGADAGTPIVVTVGQVRPVKGTDILIETAAKVKREFPRACFVVVGRVGTDAHFRRLQDRIRELGLTPNVHFYGEAENVTSLLQECDLFFLPSRSEGFSNALIEAMACRLPCVATRVGGNAEALEEAGSGFLVDNEDSDAAADRIVRLLRDSTIAARMGARGRRIVEQRFSSETMIASLMNQYERLLARRHA